MNLAGLPENIEYEKLPRMGEKQEEKISQVKLFEYSRTKTTERHPIVFAGKNSTGDKRMNCPSSPNIEKVAIAGSLRRKKRYCGRY